MMNMPEYDPFTRGPHPVGVRTFETADADGARTVPVEVWYPATSAHAGQDLDPDTRDTYELLAGSPPSPQDAVRDAEAADEASTAIVFSHGFAGHRRQTTHLCTHLASHGYVVAAPDHVGNTTADVIGWMMGGAPPSDMRGYFQQCAEVRPRDMSRTLDGLLSGEFGVQARDDGAGIAGHSFGGWTTLQTTARDNRIVAALPLAPAGGASESIGSDDPRTAFRELLDLNWGRAVPTMMIVADEDSVLPFDGMHDLRRQVESIGRMVVLINADHYHFCDNTELVHDLMAPMMGVGARPSAEYIPGAHAHAVTNGLGLAHFDAELRHIPDAASFLDRDLEELFADRGIKVQVAAG
jgi:dienelactone hydrolase